MLSIKAIADIIDMDFADDLPDDDSEERFRKHNRFLRTLKEDTLFIIDNFNTTATQDGLLSVVMKYRCRILFTTRSRFNNYTSMTLEEIGKHYDLSRERIRQIEAKALRKLRHPSRSRKLKDFMID